VDVVLESDRDAVERASDSPGAPFAVALVGVGERTRVDRDRCVQPIFIGRDSQERLGDNVSRRGATLFHGEPHLIDRCLDDGETGFRESGFGIRGAGLTL
jgi:hypothetical protein